MSRELTRQEKTAIRKLVTKWCANYDKDYGCLPLDCPCYMLGKCWTGAYCRYFRAAVLPLDPVLERYAAGVSSRMGGSGTAPRSAPGLPCGSRSGHICAASGGSAWKNSPGKRLYLQGFSGALSGWAVCFPARPCFRRNAFHIQAPGLWDILSRSPG